MNMVNLIIYLPKILIANFAVYSKRLNTFSFISGGKWQKYLLLPLLFSIVLEVIASTIKQENKTNAIFFYIMERKQ